MTNIIKTLNEGRVRFTYRKADGTTRHATGTTSPNLIPESARAENKNTETSEQVTYYDLDRNGWRQFKRSTLDEKSIETVSS